MHRYTKRRPLADSLSQTCDELSILSQTVDERYGLIIALPLQAAEMYCYWLLCLVTYLNQPRATRTPR